MRVATGTQIRMTWGLARKLAGVSDARFLTIRQAGRVIEVMKAMDASRRGERRREEANKDERLDE